MCPEHMLRATVSSPPLRPSETGTPDGCKGRPGGVDIASADRFTEGVEACTALLRAIPQRAASGLAALQLRRRAAALCAIRRPADALEDLDEAARLQPGDPATLLQRAQARCGGCLR